MSVAANTTLAVLNDVAAHGFLDFAREREIATTFVSRFAIKTPSLETPVGNLSGGNQQKVALARWLATRPSVLILDEPTQGVDVGAKAEIHRLMVDLAEEGLAILMVSSELPEVLGMSDRVGGHARRDPRGHPVPRRRDPGGRDEPGSRPSGARQRRRVIRGLLSSHRREVSVGLAALALLLLLGVVAPAFFRAANLRDLLTGNAPVLVAAIGMTLVILARQIDISIGSQFAICGVAAGLLAKAGVPMPLAGLGAVATGALLGALNGVLVAGLGLPSIVVTLATMVMLREGLRWATEGVWVQDLPAGFQWLGLGQEAGRIAIPVAALLVFVAFAWGMRHVAAGRAVYATGSDAEAARLAGIRPRARGLRGVRGHGRAHRPRRAPDRDPVHRRADERRRRSRAARHRGGGRGRDRDLRRPRQPRGHAAGRGAPRPRGAGPHLPGDAGLLGPRAPGAHHPARGLGRCLRAASRGRPWLSPRAVRSFTHERVLGLLLLGEIALFGALGAHFLSVQNAAEVARASVEIGLLALALTPVIVTGGIDLSVGSLLGLCAVVMGAAFRDLGLPIGWAALLGVMVGAAGGGLNAALIARLEIPPLIVTLGTFSLVPRARRRPHGRRRELLELS